MVNSLIKTDTQIIDKKHSGKFISNLTYDVTHITNLLSNAVLTLFKDSLTLKIAEIINSNSRVRNEMNKDGKGLGNQLNPLIKELEEQEKSIINRNINKDLINRQKEILTRLLESEKAMMERGYEEKRESKSGKDVDSSNKIRFDEYNKTKLKEIELLKSADPSLRLYYKERANQYFNLN